MHRIEISQTKCSMNQGLTRMIFWINRGWKKEYMVISGVAIVSWMIDVEDETLLSIFC